MALLRSRTDPLQTVVLQPDHLIGRGPQCSLRLPHEYISAQHAAIRWTGKAWELLDRGGRNGTFLNAAPIQPGKAYVLCGGDRVAFGNVEDEWLVADVAAPEVMVVDMDSSECAFAADGMVCIPSAEEPRFIVFRDRDGSWKLEHPDRDPVVLHQSTVFIVAGRSYRFCCPEAVPETAATSVAPRTPPLAVFSVSSDEEFVEFSLVFPGRRIELGSRTHNFMLLTLARARLADREAGIAECSCGWLYKEALADALSTTPQQIDGEVFRVRKHLAQSAQDEAAEVIERRPRTKQIRFGLPNVQILKP